MVSFIARKIKSYIEHISSPIAQKLDMISMQNGHLMFENMLLKKNINSLSDVEFGVYSQWGEDGIISFLISNILIKNKIFVEFGVENYRESNTRFLLKYFNWKGLVIDGDKYNVETIINDDIMWKHDLTVINDFVDIGNINEIISNFTGEKDVGLLSIDIDGNDYWIWKNIDVINPRIVVCEYNNLFGDQYALTVPYKKDFKRSDEHYSNLYFGASILALKKLAQEKGYCYIGSNSNGNNAFFVRNDIVDRLPKELCCVFVESRIRESRDRSGNLTYLDRVDQLNEISGMTVFDLDEGREKILSDCVV